jgi:hypothetical protein
MLSMFATSPVTTHAPAAAASALAMAALNFMSAVVRQSVLTVVPLTNAVWLHFSLLMIFFAAALLLAMAHFCAGVVVACATAVLSIAIANRPITAGRRNMLASFGE